MKYLVIACSLFIGFNLNAQFKTYDIPTLPVQFDYHPSLAIHPEGKRSWTLSSEEGTEFYVNLYKTGLRFNADSLRYLMLGLYEGADGVSNIQVNEVGSGTMGPLPAEKFVFTYTTNEGKIYVLTSYLVHFWLNRQYNSILCYFEIGERNVVSYASLQENMISSIRYKEFPYKKYTYAKDSVDLEYPDFWTAETIKGDSSEVLLIDDGRCRITIGSYIPKYDTVSVKTIADGERDKWKKDITVYPDLKISSISEKIKESGDVIAVNSGSYNKTVQGLNRRYEFRKYFIRRKTGGRTKDFVIYMEAPELYKDYYEPVFKKIYASIKLPGTVIVEEKSK